MADLLLLLIAGFAAGLLNAVAGGGILRSAETVVVPPDGNAVRIQPRTDAPVILVPRQP